MHASAIQLDQAAVAFAGETGSGKSTIATWLHQQGYTLLTDDSLLLAADRGALRVVPSYTGARLWDDSPVLASISAKKLQLLAPGSTKLRLRFDHDSPTRALPLTALLVLTPVDDATAEMVPLSGGEALMALLRHSFQLDTVDHQGSTSPLRTLGEIVNSGLRIFRLSYPHTRAALTTIEEQVRSLGVAAGAGPGA